MTRHFYSMRVPGTHVVLHYSRDEDGEEFNSEDMVEMYDGIYVKTFVIFFGELIRYYITEEHDNSIEVKRAIVLHATIYR
ncbi:MAG: DUF5717 family protein [Agathobacter rectalis]